ncbi:DNA polymerase-3 subunit gamma/tau [Rhodothalassium salexigens DSM 2132]|uniref:DNA polymerase III subunit gamma/tau n=1 Tax=Rhodothalassium salexigens DSM 2132 TaxID=1188247 RepID=A0A4R2PIP4_RHOSA|nr:DNA polymerase III subunit gamma/tau [Rhodothalassium salexigens]MBB4211600.1 DNA polymerase-3 subunit gamma/tau [Rhodothalassium salexigens DSM 2132]TCP34468.1 DNA polymerase-3 subunit gamma/tau [Rhodothalassium salexigens DSM 2132]
MDQPNEPHRPETDGQEPYRVLARKYRPQTFAELIGQEAMVRTLENAIRTGRLAHAFVLTGVRGVGKTTTARIIAKGLNCEGADGQGGPTTTPCGVCRPCQDIAASRHVDVMEMDAASRTGVDDIREIIDGVSYRAAEARFKIYIIDEVHMLSKNAFNALLKTLEEPPEHVKFIFATTEIRKVPVTILSRCQRFDLRRVETQTLVDHLARIAQAEGVEAEAPALAMIARAAEGSVRDSLSLLDQAIAHTGGAVTEALTRDILGLADRARVLDLARALFKGDAAEALAILGGLHEAGADPAVVLGDLLETVHWLTRLKVTPDAGADLLVSEAERRDGADMAGALAMAHLTRAWQMLLKGLGEVRDAPAPLAAAEMVLIRLCYAADLPSPADLVARAQGGDGGPSGGPSGGAPAGGGPAGAAGATAHTTAGAPHGQAGAPPPGRAQASVVSLAEARAQTASSPAPNPVTAPPESAPAPTHAAIPADFPALVRLVEDRREGRLSGTLRHRARLVSYTPGHLVVALVDRIDPTFAKRLKACLGDWTGEPWTVDVQTSGGGETLAEQEARQRRSELAAAEAHPKIQTVREIFPGARLLKVTHRHAETLGAPDDAGPQSQGPDDTDTEENPQ